LMGQEQKIFLQHPRRIHVLILCMRKPVMQFITPGVRSKWSKIFLQA
jgi:hypothetical protein